MNFYQFVHILLIYSFKFIFMYIMYACYGVYDIEFVKSTDLLAIYCLVILVIDGAFLSTH